MENNIEQILKELYEIDPPLRQYEGQIVGLVTEMLAVKPNTKFDANFAFELRKKLISKIEASPGCLVQRNQ